MKTINIMITMTQEQYECLVKCSSRNPDNSSIQAQLEAVVSEHITDMIDWSQTEVNSNSIEVNAN